jgi:D-arabinose 1-dehydrogenase-like Zn-dependent alcohol dehydrogenase
VTAFRAVKQLGLPARGVVGVFGLGGVGLFAVRFAKAMGFRVIGLDISKPALSAAKMYGAEEVVDSSNLDSIKIILDKATNGEGLDGSLVTTGIQAAFSGAIEHTGFNG